MGAGGSKDVGSYTLETKVNKSDGNDSSKSRRATAIISTRSVNSNKVVPFMEITVKEKATPAVACDSPARKQLVSEPTASATPFGSLNSTQSSKSTALSWISTDLDATKLTPRSFQLGVVLGKGYMGTVSLCRTNTDKFFALKTMRKDRVVQLNDVKRVFMEKRILTLLQQRSLELSQQQPNGSFHVNFFGTFQDQTNVYIAMEYIPGGELNRRLKKCTRFSLEVTKFYASEIFLAIEYLQSLNIVYRDLKPENILIDATGHIKLCDFGLSTIVNNKEDKLMSFCGTPAYMSPEQLDGSYTDGYTHIVDWWSYGVLIYELLTGKTPFVTNPDRDTPFSIFQRIFKNSIRFPLPFNNHAKAFISSLCHFDRGQRLYSPALIRKHPFFHSQVGTNIPWEAVKDKRLIPPFVPTVNNDTVGSSKYFKTKSREFGPQMMGRFMSLNDEFQWL